MISVKSYRESRSLRAAARVLVAAVCLLFVAMISANASAQTTPTLTVTSSSTTPSYGQSVTFTATISSGPTGNITFFSNNIQIGTSAITGGTTAILTTTNLPGGVDNITAEFAGDANYNAVTSAPVVVTVSKADTTLTVVSSGSPSVFGAAVTFQSTLSAAGATGTVTFYSNNTQIGSPVAVDQAKAGITTRALLGGNDQITALYSGDGNYNASTSTAILQVVTKATPTVKVTTSGTPSVFGAPVTFQATVTAGATGIVTFYGNNVLLGVGTLSGGTASFTTSSLPGGVDQITGLYSGDGNYNAATSPAITQTVGKAIPTISLATSGSPSEPGAAVTFTATMSVGPTGSVTFYIDGHATTTSPLQGNIASMTTTTLMDGTHRVTGVYSADANYASVTSSAIRQTVGEIIASTAPDEWTWLNGSMDANHAGEYGTLGTATVGTTPGARYYPSTWVDSTGGQWLFGGLGFDSTGVSGKLNDLWQYNTSTNQWTWINGNNTVGAAGGQPGVYGNTGSLAAANVPGGRQEAMSWADASGNLWLFGGQGFDQSGADGLLNDLWQYNLTTGLWTWTGGSATIPACGGPNCGATGVYGTMGTAAQANIPGGRYYASTWIDHSGNLWLFGGSGIDANGTFGQANDLWEFTPSTSEWTWVGGSSGFGSGAIPGVYGVLGMAASGNWPGSRDSAISWTDAKGNFWLFGGEGVDASGVSGLLNDLWEFAPSTGEWTWVAGSSTVGTGGQPGVYGTLGSFAAANTPGGREGAMNWLDSQGILWLLGGNGFDSAHASGDLNDLWQFDTASSQWAWMAGSSTIGSSPSGPAPVFGTLGSPAPANTPGGRQYGASWTDTEGNFWLFGGDGADAKAALGPMNDIWEFAPYPIVSTPIFSIAGGTYSSNQSVTITEGTTGATVYFTTNGTTPTKSSTVYSGPITVSANETLEAFATLTGYSNSPVATATFTVVTATPTFSLAAGTFDSSQTVSLSDSTTGAVIYYTLDGSAPTTASTQYSSPLTVSSTTTINAIAVAPGQNASAVATAMYVITPPPPDFAVTASPASLDVTAGQSATTTVTVTPSNAFASAVTFACSGLPTGATCTFAPATVTPTTGAISTTLTVATTSTTAALRRNSIPFGPQAVLAAALILVGFRKRRNLLILTLLVASAIGLGALSGCGGSSSQTNQTPPPTTTTVTVTATSGTLQHTTTFTLTVSQ